MTQKNIHSFHIPVMGLAYTIDTPIRVAKYGISSVVSIVDDELIEKMNAFYCQKFQLPYQEIGIKVDDFRAKRITTYLNNIDKIVKFKFEEFKNELVENNTVFNDFIALLPKKSDIKERLLQIVKEGNDVKFQIKEFVEAHLKPGAIDVNIMTKVDKDNYIKSEKLPIEYNDAHAALRGFAISNLNSSIVLSAGMNPRLYSYFENFEDFYPDKDGNLKKKIILKVSDFRSAMIQGNFLAKKGLWVSEYRIESGLNCGGHAFATEGFLLGPILEEFKEKRKELIDSAFSILQKALELKGKEMPKNTLPLKITVQGGVGTTSEHDFLLNYYQTDSVGWGSPFLLVPEATLCDTETRNLLMNAKEEDLYLSHISPLGIPFNTVKGTTNESIKNYRINKNNPGSSCPKKFLALNKLYSEKGLCTASRKFQEKEIFKLNEKKTTLTDNQFNKEYQSITQKACLCVGLANSSYLENNIKIKGEEQGVVVCPGPNIAYFNKQYSLIEMVQHIYGNKSVIDEVNRPNMFVKELELYYNYYRKEVEQALQFGNEAAQKKLTVFKSNLLNGIAYYKLLFVKESSCFKEIVESALMQIESLKSKIENVKLI